MLVDPHKETGQNLYRQYASKKGKIVLNARWVHECVKAGELQTFHSNWAGCKVNGTEKVGAASPAPSTSTAVTDGQTVQTHPQAISQPMAAPVDPLQNTFPYQVYTTALHPASRGMPPTGGPPQSWQAPNAIAPQQTHIAPPPQSHMMARATQPYRPEPWAAYDQTSGAPNGIAGAAPPGYDYRYRDDQAAWVGPAGGYYDPTYGQHYGEAAPYLQESGPPNAEEVQPTHAVYDPSEKPRGRKRTRTQSAPTATATSLVANKNNPPARSPTPPTRVIKSTYGGNLFTAEDIDYLKKYIDYCQEEGLVLSLREICERIAIKAPHHTFYSWRRYCNKHQIRLGGYTMTAERSASPVEDQEPEEEESVRAGPGPGTIAAARQRLDEEPEPVRNRSPTPPRALYRSTTGKGVAFTDEDVRFMVRFMDYRKSQGRLDMVAFWKDVAEKAPHHSRASWMKFWRRHKHELHRTETDDPLPNPPEKKMRYSREDDFLLARWLFTKPEGTSDKVFQAFARVNPHHPWKGWQEHHRIHKAKIDHYVQQLANGQEVLTEDAPPGVVV
ncbi:hypothetical protein PLICRDRAFT_468996 [Plicaturopsis crispa FD-325 SS-3]|nr:hypothetical protein PLICRDRAFT_468996 [Plicaturopsis crispa FD-325 SS-3]